MKNLSHKFNCKDKQNIVPFPMPLLKINEGKNHEYFESSGSNIEEIEREAYEKGFEAGEKAGFAMGEKKAMVLLERIDNLLNELLVIKNKILKETEPQIIELEVEIAKKIIMKELSLDHKIIINMIREAITKIERIGRITIKINPSLNEMINKYKKDFMDIHPDINFEIDTSCSSSGVVVISSSQEVVTDIDIQIKNLIEEMVKNLHGN